MASKLPPTIAIVTSGGDSQGMNAAIRGAVRAALDKGAMIYGICEGYEGLVEVRSPQQ
jgi:6-phosphofructokinase 1